MPTAFVIDDDAQIRRLLEIALARIGGWTVHVADSLEAASALGAIVPDVMLVDVMLGEGDGREVLRWQREGFLPSAPVVFVTALVRDEQRAQYLGLGAIGVIEKPFDPMEVARAVERMLCERADGAPR